MACCCGDRIPPRPGSKENRSCTDILCLLIFLVFTAAWVFVAVIAFQNGNLNWILHGVDYKGNVCSIESATTPNATQLATASYGTNWTGRKYVWYPIDTDLLLDSASLSTTDILLKILRMGICVDRCPEANGELFKPNQLVSPYGDYTFSIWYQSTDPILNRCIPDITSNKTLPQLKALIDVFGDITGLGQLWAYFESEMIVALPILGIGVGTAILLSIIWIILLRFTVGFFVYLVLILVEILFAGGCAILFWQAFYIEDNAALDDPWRDYILPFQIIACVSGVLFLLVTFVILFMWRRIRIAVEILRLAAKVMGKAPTLILVPLISTVLIICVGVFALFVGACIFAAGEITLEDISIKVPFTNETVTVETSAISENWDAKWIFTIFNLFQFLWYMGLINAIAFMSIAFVTVMYYFSVPQGRGDKKIPFCAVGVGAWWTLRYHLGTVAFGSFIIAVIQLIRIAASYIQSKVEQSHGDAAKWVGRCVQCYLAYLERIVTWINKNAYIICAIQSSNFCWSAKTAIGLLISNIADVAAANFIADAIFIFCKIAITGTNVVVMWALFKTELGEGAKVLAVPLVIGGLITWILSSLFMHIYDSVQDTALMCFLWDKENNNGTDEKPYYFNDALSDIIDKFNYNKGESKQKTRLNKIQPVTSTG
mmetsp:Transcript_118473/g.206223  ORF Transcript_118473/g.206223 Transcript_118473/m.206223 type:complete len:658 (-) Transcript_118473:306-2279(-)